MVSKSSTTTSTSSESDDFDEKKLVLVVLVVLLVLVEIVFIVVRDCFNVDVEITDSSAVSVELDRLIGAVETFSSFIITSFSIGKVGEIGEVAVLTALACDRKIMSVLFTFFFFGVVEHFGK